MPVTPLRPRSSTLVWLLALAAIVALVTWNARFLFQTPLHESSDAAANTLSVLRAERFHELYGSYSRWNFHHPGPALFYFWAALEGIFYWTLHLMPTPYNSQVLGAILVTVTFTFAAFAAAAGWVRSRLFVPLALLLFALHFSAVNMATVVTNTWTAYLVPLVFLGLMVTSASVLSGEGRDLPWLMAAGCLLVHLHVAQPLFVVPLFALGYLGLAWTCFRLNRTAPWRVYSRAHGVAAVILALALLPLVIDWTRGASSNFALILDHLRTHQGEKHPWPDAVFYFLRFASYRPSAPNNPFFAGHTQPGEIPQFLLAHIKTAIIWSVAFVAPFAAWVVYLLTRLPAAAVAKDETVAPRIELRSGRWRFVGALLVVWLLSVGLTLYWGHIQDGEMDYYNAWFNYSIYYVLALIAGISLLDIFESLTPWSLNQGWVAGVLGVLILAGAADVFYQHREQLRCADTDPLSNRRVELIQAALKADNWPTRPRLLLFPHDSWPTATGIAVVIERLGFRPRVTGDWKIMFGDDLFVRDEQLPGMLLEGPTDELRLSTEVHPSTDDGIDIWRIVPIRGDPAADPGRVDAENELLTRPVDVDPVQGVTITFGGTAPDSDHYVVYGWNPPDSTLAPFAWTEGTSGAIMFHAIPVPADASVELLLDCGPPARNGRDSQRLSIACNGAPLGDYEIADGAQVRPLIPAELWNRRPDLVLTFSYPDARSMRDLGQGDDERKISIACKTLSFRVADSSPPAMSTPSATPAPVSAPAVSPSPATTPAR